VGVVGFVVYVYGALLFCGQTYYWLRSGAWVQLPAIMLAVDEPSGASTAAPVGGKTFRQIIPLLPIPEVRDWLISPVSWLGLHQVVDRALRYLSVPVVTILLGLLLVASLFRG
jgi:hypothetical protein